MKKKEFLEKYEKLIYIGDSVYVKFDGYHIILETHNGLEGDPSNSIGLEDIVMRNLDNYRRELNNDIKEIDYTN